jgi:hypothetical protein
MGWYVFIWIWQRYGGGLLPGWDVNNARKPFGPAVKIRNV